MKESQQRQLDRFRRVQDFLDTHADQVGALKDTVGGKQLADAVANITAQENVQGTAGLIMAGQSNRQESLIKELKERYTGPIADFARSRLRGVPDFAALTKSTNGLQPKALIRAARAMASAAAPYGDVFKSGGLPADVAKQLTDAAIALDKAITERANTKVGRVKATKGIEQDVKQGADAVGTLDAAIRSQFAGDKTFLAAWRAARRVNAKPGFARGAGASFAPGYVPSQPDRTTPASPPVTGAGVVTDKTVSE